MTTDNKKMISYDECESILKKHSNICWDDYDGVIDAMLEACQVVLDMNDEYKPTIVSIESGDVFDIGQTINGVSKFLWFNNKWYYYNDKMSSCEYEYNQEDLTKLVLDDLNGLSITSGVKYLGNIYKCIHTIN